MNNETVIYRFEWLPMELTVPDTQESMEQMNGVILECIKGGCDMACDCGVVAELGESTALADHVNRMRSGHRHMIRGRS